MIYRKRSRILLYNVTKYRGTLRQLRIYSCNAKFFLYNYELYQHKYNIQDILHNINILYYHTISYHQRKNSRRDYISTALKKFTQ